MPTSPFFKLGATATVLFMAPALAANADTPLVVPPAPANNPAQTIVTPPTEKTFMAGESFMGTPSVQGATPQVGATQGAGSQVPSALAPAPPPRPTAQDAQKLLESWRIYRAMKTPFNLTVEKATLEEIVAQIKKQLPAPAPQIEIRNAKPIRFSFALKNSTAWEALETAGWFAGLQLWSLPDRLLLASEASLTKEDYGGDAGYPDSQWVFSSLLVDEITAKMKGQPQPPTNNSDPGAKPTFRVTFDQLSPDGKEMLASLVDNLNTMNRSPMSSSATSGVPELQNDLVLLPTTVVQISPGAAATNGVPVDTVGVTTGNRVLTWAADGHSYFNGFTRPLSGASGSVAAPVLDLSANKS